MKTVRTYVLSAALMALALAMAVLWPNAPTEKRIYAQFVGATQPSGFFASGSNIAAYTPTLTAGAGALSVSNPAANGVINVEGGDVYCFNGGMDTVGRSQINLTLSQTYLVVFNCPSNEIYAKTAVTAPGGQLSTTAPGTPGTFLAAAQGVEVPLALVVCNATACGNGANGSITDKRPAANFSQSHIVMAGNAASSKDTVGTATLASGAVTVTFANAYASAPVCVATYTATGAGTGILKAAPTTTNVALTSSVATDTATVQYWCSGNPN